MTERVIRRQPEVLHIVPSKPNPWYGSIVEGDPLTIEQRRALAERGLAEDTPTMIVYRQATDREMWWGLNSAPPVFEFECPIIGHRAQTKASPPKVKILSPNGEAKLVFPDGWTRRPHRLNRKYIAQREAERAAVNGLGDPI